MTKHPNMRIETAKRLSPVQELAIVRAAFSRQPESAMLRARLAALSNLCDAFDDTIDLLDRRSYGAETYGEYRLLAQAYLSRETTPDTRRAREAGVQAYALADDDVARAAALADQAKADIRLGNIAAAKETLTRALALDPASKDACKRLAALHFRAGEAHAALALTHELEARGAGHSRLFAARAVALAQLGEIEAARAATGLAMFRHQQMLTAPPGWPSIAAFNTALAAELLAHPGLRYERYGTASDQTWRIDAPATGDAPLVRTLLAAIVQLAQAKFDLVGTHDHPWARARPPGGILHSWCVITESTGFETWHVHQFGWMSGVYYVQVPHAIAQGEGDAGCLSFGLSEELAGASAARAYGEERIRPQPGLLLLFPSHAYHRTFPHGQPERRICVAFDIWPA
jgi:tetratricopeptide (TPR) repeat protein